ncbi:MAG: hypothetical protein TQ37_04360 [Candidatus Synechococcus spongiarum 15L]|uniref:Uncharacterized protein n=1 Tax=Candidatus Synechococcus spongiarum 15L TaxID=1608419 RepID=A0A0G8AWU2_9SYNE|nr:MAG: hypothetical protein TQ37_04360 [Candidatus Synechococcus spongiarum 15L]
MNIEERCQPKQIAKIPSICLHCDADHLRRCRKLKDDHRQGTKGVAIDLHDNLWCSSREEK